jgi:hypothetical protein
MFDPSTTPTPTSPWPDSSAATAEQISGASAPSAVTTPSRPSDSRSRAPMHSSAATRRTLAHDITPTDAANAIQVISCSTAR